MMLNWIRYGDTTAALLKRFPCRVSTDALVLSACDGIS